MTRFGNRKAFGTIRLAIHLVVSADRRRLFFIVGATIITSLAVAAQLLIGRKLLDLISAESGATARELAPYLVLLAATLLIGSMGQAMATEHRVLLGEKVHRRTMNEVLDTATEVDLEEYERPEFHDRLGRATAAAGGQSSAVVFGLVTMVSTFAVSLGVVGVLITVTPTLIPIAVAGAIPVVVVNVRNNRARYEMERSQTELLRERGYFEYLMTGRGEAKEVRAYGTAPTLRTWHDALWDTRLTALRQLVARRLRLSLAGSFVTTAVLVGTLSFTLILAGRGTISIGDAAIAVVGLQQLSNRLQSAGAAFTGVHEGMTFLRDFESFRATLPTIRESRPTGLPPSPPTSVSVRGLTYRYPGATTDALKNVSFEVRRGQIMAIVGANGSGKTTLSKLLCGLLTPTAGAIAWDGVDLATCDPERVRRQIAPVFQDFVCYMLPIDKAIGLGDTGRLDDRAAIMQAAVYAGIDDVIASRDGLDARLGKMFAGGTDLSIGQWQRLAVARALFRDAPLVILDEPSAALDPRAEADLFDLLQKLGDDRIVIFVSHRFATVRTADVVLVMDQGEVVEMGSHDELMSTGGLYKDLFTLQADRYGISGT